MRPTTKKRVLVVLGVAAAGTVGFFAAPFVAASLGAAGILGAASTGTAISGLSGAALTNASLAALGGGALSAGGAGIVGGTTLVTVASAGVGGGVITGSVLTSS